MGASDWWAKKLGNPAQASQPQSPAPVIMPGMQQQPQQVQQPVQQAQPGSYDANTGQPVQDDGVMAQIVNAALSTGGSQRVKEDSGVCPECSSGNYFARKYTESGMPLRVAASPQCFDCGYPIIQAGSTRGGATSARNDGTATRARQLPKGHEVTVVGEGGRLQTYQAR